MGQGLRDGRVAHRRKHGLCGGEHAPPRRSQAAHLAHARRRQDMGTHRRWHSRRPDRERGEGGSEAAWAALCRHGTHGVRLGRRRQSLAVAPAQPPGDLGPRPRDQGRRPCHRHARTGILDPRQHHAAPAARCGVGWRTSLCAAGGSARAMEHVHGYADPAGGAERRESAGWGDRGLLARRARDGRHHTRGARRKGGTHTPLREQRSGGAAARVPQHSRLLDPSAAATERRRGDAPLPVGFAVSTTERRELRLPDRCRVHEHGKGTARVVGAAGHIHGAADGRWRPPRTTPRRAHGPACEDAVASTPANVHAVADAGQRDRGRGRRCHSRARTPRAGAHASHGVRRRCRRRRAHRVRHQARRPRRPGRRVWRRWGRRRTRCGR